jgi:hypothetical protein
MADLALSQRDDPHADEGEPLVDRGCVLLIAAEAIERFGDDDVVLVCGVQ